MAKGLPDGTEEIGIADSSNETDIIHLVYKVEQNSFIRRKWATGYLGEIFYGPGERGLGVIRDNPPYKLPSEELTVRENPESWIDYGIKIAEAIQERIAAQEGNK